MQACALFMYLGLCFIYSRPLYYVCTLCHVLSYIQIDTCIIVLCMDLVLFIDLCIVYGSSPIYKSIYYVWIQSYLQIYVLCMDLVLYIDLCIMNGSSPIYRSMYNEWIQSIIYRSMHYVLIQVYIYSIYYVWFQTFIYSMSTIYIYRPICIICILCILYGSRPKCIICIFYRYPLSRVVSLP